MSRITGKKSRLIIGIERVIDRQNMKEPFIQVAVNEFQYTVYKNKKVKAETLENFYFPLRWQPLKYVIKPVAHTTYTYEVSKLPIGQQAIKQLKRKRLILTFKI